MIYKPRFLGIPIATRGNRRWLIAAYWVVCLSVLGGCAAVLHAHPLWLGKLQMGFLYAFALVGASGLGRLVWDSGPTPEKVSGGIRTVFDSALRGRRTKNPPMDERETRQWDKAYRRAYGYICLLLWVCLCIHIGHFLGPGSPLREPLIWMAMLVIFNLPQSMLLWNEPDMEEMQ